MYIVYALLAILIIALDRVVKNWIMLNVSLGETFAHLPLFDFTYVQNEGAAFSILSGRLGILSLISVVFCVGVLLYFIIKTVIIKLRI